MKAVVFDMDGVLFDTEQLCLQGWTAIAQQECLSGMEEIFPLCVGRSAKDTREIMMNAYGENFDYESFREKSSAWFWGYIEKNGLPVKLGVEEILSWLKTSGYTVGLASSTKRSSVLNHLERAGIRDYFSVVVTGDMIEHSKPNPDIYLLACKKLDVEPGEAYAVEDSPNGIRASYSAGMKPLLVPDMIAPDEEMREKSHRIFKDLKEVLAYLQSDEEAQ